MKFKYQAKTKEGEMQVGYVEAANKEAATTILIGHNLFILSLESTEAVHWYDRLVNLFQGVRRKDVVIFARQLATLLEARLPLTTALKTLYDQTSHPTLKQAVREISEDVSAGLSFSQALERHSTIFPAFYVSMVRSAEVIGNLEEVAGFLADFLEKEYELLSKARSALIYPIIVIGLFIVVAFIMITFVFPQIGPVFEQSGVPLPFFTKILLGAGTFFANWWLLLVLLMIIVFIIAFNYFQTAEGTALWDDLKIRMPVISRIYMPLTITRLSNVMSMLLQGGVPVTQGLEIAGQTINNVLYRDLLNDVSEEVRQGKQLSASLEKYPEYFPQLVTQMVAVGEATGQIDKMFARLARFYGRDADSAIANIVELIQPILMIVIGVLVGLLFASVLIPLYRLTATVQ